MFKRGLAIALLLLVTACGKAELYGKLTETQANEMVAVLQNAGIDADKISAGEAGFSIATSKEDFGRAVQLLRAQGYPRDEFASLGTVFKKEGFVSSPLEERARLVYGLSQELSNTVSQIDGVVQARVQLAMPEADPLSDKIKPSSASVFIKYRPGSSPEKQVGQIKSLMVNAVEGLTYENVTVAMFPAQPLPLAVPPSPVERITGNAALLVVPIVLIGAVFLGWPTFRRWQMRRRSLVPRTPE
ncbi:type III secretion system inner membrane ring lipoprotein SctJ [Glacieibacterium frigidum]|uniref:Lipoprotein n=1 Tax=Glacieibacterium frigidum TaxID=2593303 RepID=A0A552UJH1_9SPHN|nr:type III secretion inner membrane ring lipoprotein SctJ [Glacieibacterium frigidum]TRW18386.1 EscJ/YscJ/HrcJ family type III secretion inner membrane ring protein [Glacieibacterium frigidum]